MLMYRRACQFCWVLITVLSAHVTGARPVAASNDLLKTSFTGNSIQTSARSSSELILPEGPHISPLKYKRAFKISLPLKPKLFKHIHPHLHKKNNQSFKRDLKHAHFYRQKHVPFIKSINLLFGDIHHARNQLLDNGDAYNPIRNFAAQEHNVDLQPEGSISSQVAIPANDTTAYKTEEAVVVSTNNTIEFPSNPENTTETSFSGPIANEIHSAIITFKNTTSTLPELPPRHSPRSWGDDDRYNYRNSTTNYADLKRDLPRNNGDNDNSSTIGKFGIPAENIPEYTNTSSRNSTDGSFSGKTGGRGDGRYTIDRIIPGSRINEARRENERSPKTTGINKRFEFQNKIKDRRNKIKESIDEKFRTELRGPVAKTKEIDGQEPLQPRYVIGESNNSDTQNYSSNQGVLRRNSTTTIQTEEPGSNRIENNDRIFELMNNETHPENAIEIISGYSNYNVNYNKTNV